MIVCDRCKKQPAEQVRNLVPEHGTDLCKSCIKDLDDILKKFLGAISFSLDSPSVGKDIDPADEPGDHVK